MDLTTRGGGVRSYRSPFADRAIAGRAGMDCPAGSGMRTRSLSEQTRTKAARGWLCWVLRYTVPGIREKSSMKPSLMPHCVRPKGWAARLARVSGWKIWPRNPACRCCQAREDRSPSMFRGLRTCHRNYRNYTVINFRHNAYRLIARSGLVALIQFCIMTFPANAETPRIIIRYDGAKLVELCGDLRQNSNNLDICRGYIIGFMQAKGMLSHRSGSFIECSISLIPDIFSDFKDRWTSKPSPQNLTYTLVRSIESACSNPDGKN